MQARGARCGIKAADAQQRLRDGARMTAVATLDCPGRVSDGVTVSNIAENLDTLAVAASLVPIEDGSAATARGICAVVLSWFDSFGVTGERLNKWVKMSVVQDAQYCVYDAINMFNEGNLCRPRLKTMYPLARTLDARLVVERQVVPLYGDDADSVRETSRVLEVLDRSAARVLEARTNTPQYGKAIDAATREMALRIVSAIRIEGGCAGLVDLASLSRVSGMLLRAPIAPRPSEEELSVARTMEVCEKFLAAVLDVVGDAEDKNNVLAALLAGFVEVHSLTIDVLQLKNETYRDVVLTAVAEAVCNQVPTKHPTVAKILRELKWIEDHVGIGVCPTTQ